MCLGKYMNTVFNGWKILEEGQPICKFLIHLGNPRRKIRVDLLA